MARLGLGSQWNCVLANDISAKKCDVYKQNFGAEHLVQSDIAELETQRLLQPIDLYWASSPCQDLSIAGKGEGFLGDRSGTFHCWLKKVSAAVEKSYQPRLIAFENVVGLITRNKGRDFAAVVSAFVDLGYRVGALEIDAAAFLPQSRPRLFVIAVRQDIEPCPSLEAMKPDSPFSTRRILTAFERLPDRYRRDWVWWKLDPPLGARKNIKELIDLRSDSGLLNQADIDRLMAMMTETNKQKVEERMSANAVDVGFLYKRGRPDAHGKVRQRAEVRFDGIAGCLRTPAGGSSRQTVVIVGRGEIKARLLYVREAARLMGVPDTYSLPDRYNDAYHLLGDGVAVPVVEHLKQRLFNPLMALQTRGKIAA